MDDMEWKEWNEMKWVVIATYKVTATIYKRKIVYLQALQINILKYGNRNKGEDRISQRGV